MRPDRRTGFLGLAWLGVLGAALVTAGLGLPTEASSTPREGRLAATHPPAAGSAADVEGDGLAASPRADQGAGAGGAARGPSPGDASAAGSATGVTVPVPSDLSAYKTGEFALAVEVTPACVARGQEAVARVTAAPGASLSLAVMYPDGSNRANWHVGPAQPDGTLTFTWLVPLDVPLGDGMVMVAGHDSASGADGTNAASFRIDDGCPR